MIIIEIKNAKEVAKREKGRLKVFFATLFGYDVEKQVDQVVAERIADELRRKNIDAQISIE